MLQKVDGGGWPYALLDTVVVLVDEWIRIISSTLRHILMCTGVKPKQNATKRNKTQQYSTRQLQFLQTLTLTRQLQFLQLIIPTYANIRILFKKGAKTNPKLQETCVSMSVCLSRKTIFSARDAYLIRLPLLV